MKLIDIQHVSKRFSNHVALDDVSFSIEKGSVFGLLGPNGAGKTTLIRILTQISLPDSGKILFNGKPLQRADIENIGYLPEERGLYKKMKVGDQALYFAQLKGLSKTDAREKLQRWFKKFNIESWWDRKVEELSKGMQQKVQFITTIVHEPDFLIFDEPFSGFDPVNAELLKNEILELKKRGTTIILSTHNMASVEEICDEIVLINRARKILEGKIQEVKQQFKKNLFSLEVRALAPNFAEQLPQEFQILSQKTSAHSTALTLMISPEKSANDLLAFVIQHADIQQFSEILPTMNEIFIQSVQ